MATQNTPAQDSAIANQMARNAIIQNAVKQLMPVASANMALTGGALQSPIVQLSPTPTGVQLGFYVTVTANITNGSGGVLTRTPFAASNLLQNVTYYDLGNTPRTNASGKMLHMLMSQKASRVFGATVAPDDGTAPVYGSWNVNQCPATIANGATATIKMIFYVPLAYSEFDLRGAVYGNIAQSNQRLNLTFPTSAQLIATSTENPVDAVYQAAGATKAVTINSWSYDVRLNTYGAGLPTAANGQTIVPLNDLSTVYALNETVVSGLTAGQQLAVPFPNAWEYISTTGLYVNGAQLNAGTDMADIEVKTASGVSFGAVPPDLHAFTTGLRIGAHPPAGMYFDSHHQRPIKVADFGAVNYCIRPSQVNAGASYRIAYEFFERLANFQAIGLTM
jgi:hypothetical protein